MTNAPPPVRDISPRDFPPGSSRPSSRASAASWRPSPTASTACTTWSPGHWSSSRV